MIKDKLLRFLSIPLLGILIPFLSNIITYKNYNTLELITINLYFISMSWCIWNCSTWLHHKIRNLFPPDENAFPKISTVSLTNALFGGAIAGIMTLVWYKISNEHFGWTSYLITVVLSILAVIVFTLIYEILYLSKERDLDNKIVDQLDWERSAAELSNLKNELEPHFIFNSLNTLSHLIVTDPQTAHLFNSKLGSVYKYFLVNKDRDLISLNNEIEFIENYFFLIQLRHNNSLQLNSNLDMRVNSPYLILPFALQTAVENAIKHNEFSCTDPLLINIELCNDFLLVQNNKKEKKYPEYSTGIGLKNLRSRYRYFCNQNISIENTEDSFVIKLPLIHQNIQYDKRNNN